LEERARNLSKQLRCLVCQNQSIDDSDADLARDLRREVRSQIAAGTSDDAIIDQLRAKYGDYVLLNPPLDQATLFLWLSPLGFILLGGLIVMMARRQRGAAITKELNSSDNLRIKST
ncbi:MAG: cytochrome c-type biogenesis protein CcmH, partial [Alphaproteobacteria bacterium]|nr:cytochrome c-type biogenesis protein CcmH [Alphaproteobacteria bacterium]